MMATAVAVAATAIGKTAANPAVGCVLVKNGVILSKAATGDGGAPHAEAAALSSLDRAASEGATAYLTLEPCAHHGRNPPCVELLVAAGVARVVAAAEDPNSLVGGRGIAALRAAAIRVEILPSAAAELLNCGFFMRMRAARPWVTLKMAMDKRGAIAERDRRSRISGAAADNFNHSLRLQADAVAVGANTAAIDKPLLTCRLAGGEAFSPQPIIFSRSGKGRGILENALVLSADNLPACLRLLANRGINRLLLEGGATLAAEFLRGELVDEIYLVRSPKILGGRCLFAPRQLLALKGFNQVHRLGDDVVEHRYV